MKTTSPALLAVALASILCACSSDDTDDGSGTAGSGGSGSGTGGSDSGATGGNATGGNAAGGNAAGGNAAGGNAAGGNTAGGNTAGGNTAGGNTAGGNTAGGNTAGGSTASGGTASGGVGGGLGPGKESMICVGSDQTVTNCSSFCQSHGKACSDVSGSAEGCLGGSMVYYAEADCRDVLIGHPCSTDIDWSREGAASVSCCCK